MYLGVSRGVVQSCAHTGHSALHSGKAQPLLPSTAGGTTANGHVAVLCGQVHRYVARGTHMPAHPSVHTTTAVVKPPPPPRSTHTHHFTPIYTYRCERRRAQPQSHYVLTHAKDASVAALPCACNGAPEQRGAIVARPQPSTCRYYNNA